eukprot:6182121-Pleurochrysis_carterae.AAC.2
MHSSAVRTAKGSALRTRSEPGRMCWSAPDATGVGAAMQYDSTASHPRWPHPSDTCTQNGNGSLYDVDTGNKEKDTKMKAGTKRRPIWNKTLGWVSDDYLNTNITKTTSEMGA